MRSSELSKATKCAVVQDLVKNLESLFPNKCASIFGRKLPLLKIALYRLMVALPRAFDSRKVTNSFDTTGMLESEPGKHLRKCSEWTNMLKYRPADAQNVLNAVPNLQAKFAEQGFISDEQWQEVLGMPRATEIETICVEPPPSYESDPFRLPEPNPEARGGRSSSRSRRRVGGASAHRLKLRRQRPSGSNN